MYNSIKYIQLYKYISIHSISGCKIMQHDSTTRKQMIFFIRQLISE
ncbi:hypothetical protein HMPREF0373_00827 [Eubacterium ramulus ATCC 29099]|uniref:Uncharacterized protein n=1 Tax=Eubacterium ramulus ATCC 29099 TaxID=1256908 RepID=U2Q0Y1_EUBRA|nr:hypothetical protein HMPREF0373_00827 [Eubacterium ramulus ATCC 29099]